MLSASEGDSELDAWERDVRGIGVNEGRLEVARSSATPPCRTIVFVESIEARFPEALESVFLGL